MRVLPIGFGISFYLNHGCVAKVINEHMAGVAAATSHKFANGQEVSRCYDNDLFLDERGIDWKLSDFHHQLYKSLQTGDEIGCLQQKCRFWFKKRPFYPLNYGNKDICDLNLR